jgi:hypothetical protein
MDIILPTSIDIYVAEASLGVSATAFFIAVKLADLLLADWIK